MIGTIEPTESLQLIHDMEELTESLLQEKSISEIAEETMDFIDRQDLSYSGSALDHMESMQDRLYNAEESGDRLATAVLDRWSSWNYGDSLVAYTAA